MLPTIESEFYGKVIVIRPTLEEELLKVVELHKHPLIKPYQYKIRPDYHEKLKSIWSYNQDAEKGRRALEFYSILLDGEMIGNITVCCLFGIDMDKVDNSIRRPHSFGWNLHPDYWGNGYMYQSLEMLFDNVFSRNHDFLVRIECFDFNERCIRLIGKLGFQSRRLSGLQHFLLRLNRRCFHRHLRFDLTRNDFESRPKTIKSR